MRRPGIGRSGAVRGLPVGEINDELLARRRHLVPMSPTENLRKEQ